MDKHYTVLAVAAAYEVHPETVRDWCRDGKLEFNKIGHAYRFTDEQLARFESKGDTRAKRVRALERVERRLAKAR